MKNIEPRTIDGLQDIAADYNALICDIWGVLHNGKTAYGGAAEALVRFRSAKEDAKGKDNKKVVLLSNAPRPAANVQEKLDSIGIARGAYDAIMTSGDLARQMVLERGGRGEVCCHVGPPKDACLVAGLDVPFVSVAEMKRADYILLSGLFDDMRESPADYEALIEAALKQGLAMVCANPDRQVQFGERVIYCAGAVAEVYEQRGGEVVWVGKPYPTIYAHVRQALGEMLGRDVVPLAIGDGCKTDMVGAAAAGIDALFIAGGLGNALNDALNEEHDETPAALLAAEKTHAAFAMQHLVW